MYRIKAKEVNKAQQELERESYLKEKAIITAAELREEVEMLKGDEETVFS